MILKMCAVGSMAIAIACAFFLYAPYARSAETHARAIIEACVDDTDWQLCYEKRIPALMDEGLSMEDAFEVTKNVQEFDSRYTYCHVLAHNITAKETQKDFTRWKEVIARAPSGVCGNGALHGAFQERFRTDSQPEKSVAAFVEDLQGVCDERNDWHPTPIERASCFHGIGHLGMYMTAADVHTSTALCDALSENKDLKRTCIEGVFMQIFQPLEPEDEGLVEDIVPKKEERLLFCGTYSNDIYAACIKESWPLMRKEIQTIDGFAHFCLPLAANNSAYESCIGGISYVVMGMLQYDSSTMINYCMALKGKGPALCINGLTSRFIETDWKFIPQAVAVCDSLEGILQTTCFENLINFAAQALRKDSEEAATLCSLMNGATRTHCSALTTTL